MIEIYTKNGTTIPHTSFVFSGGEVQVIVKPDEHDILKKVDIYAKITNSMLLMELLLVTDALRRLGSKTIDLHMHYIPYARQDRVCNVGESLSLKVFCDLINSAKYNSVNVVDPHSDVAIALLNNVNVTKQYKYAYYAVKHFRPDLIISPDGGSLKKCIELTTFINSEKNTTLLPIVIGGKVRNVKDGSITSTTIDNPYLVKGKKCLIVDDICDGGRTFTALAEVLRDNGASNVYLYVTHGIFSKNIEALHNIDGIFTTDSIPQIPNPKLTIYKIGK